MVKSYTDTLTLIWVSSFEYVLKRTESLHDVLERFCSSHPINSHE